MGGLPWTAGIDHDALVLQLLCQHTRVAGLKRLADTCTEHQLKHRPMPGMCLQSHTKMVGWALCCAVQLRCGCWLRSSAYTQNSLIGACHKSPSFCMYAGSSPYMLLLQPSCACRPARMSDTNLSLNCTSSSTPATHNVTAAECTQRYSKEPQCCLHCTAVRSRHTCSIKLHASCNHQCLCAARSNMLGR